MTSASFLAAAVWCEFKLTAPPQDEAGPGHEEAEAGGGVVAICGDEAPQPPGRVAALQVEAQRAGRRGPRRRRRRRVDPRGVPQADHDVHQQRRGGARGPPRWLAGEENRLQLGMDAGKGHKPVVNETSS